MRLLPHRRKGNEGHFRTGLENNRGRLDYDLWKCNFGCQQAKGSGTDADIRSTIRS
jgi:hypothetical protein